MEPKNFYLKTFNLATNLNEVQLQQLCGIISQKEAKKGQVVYSKGGDKKVFMLISGKVKISEINDSGDEMIKEIALPGDLFGDLLMNQSGGNFEYAEIVSERATYYCIEAHELNAQIQSSPALMANYMTKVGEKFRNMESRYLNMITKDVKSRLLYCFREWARKEGRKLGDKVVIKNSLTHSDLANMISTSRQTVTVILNELKDAGAISYNRREIEFSQIMLAS
jgi:CRP/FNR family transcriptional regulator